MRETIPETRSDYEEVVVTERPDGFYWRARSDTREYGPFESYLAAIADADARGEDTTEAGETLAEAESEFGVADWIDEETGQPGEASTPRLEQH